MKNFVIKHTALIIFMSLWPKAYRRDFKAAIHVASCLRMYSPS